MSLEVRETTDDKLLLWFQGQALELKEMEKVQREKKVKGASPAQPRKPAASHPWSDIPTKIGTSLFS